MSENNKSEAISLQGSWILVNNVEEAEEATSLDKSKQEENEKQENTDSDLDSDGISVISDTHLQDSNTEDENSGKKEEITEGTPLKWTFVGDPENATDPSKNFYLNCMQEPVQELSEQELGSINSDFESDGVSIISDTDDYLQESAVVNESKEVLANSTRVVWLDLKKYCSNFVVFSTVSLAILSIIFSPYFSNSIVSEDEVSVYSDQNLDLNNAKNYDVLDPVVYCREKHKKDGIYREINIKKCKKCLKKVEKDKRKQKPVKIKEKKLKKNYNETEHEKYLKHKEEYLKQKEERLNQKEHELHKAEIKLKKHQLKINNFDIADKDINKKAFKKLYKTKYLRELKDKKKSIDKKHKYKNNYGNFIIKNENKTMTGFWYIELNKGRHIIRKLEHESDWLFDRAQLRNKKRKAHYHFLDMNRDTNRYKKFTH